MGAWDMIKDPDYRAMMEQWDRDDEEAERLYNPEAYQERLYREAERANRLYQTYGDKLEPYVREQAKEREEKERLYYTPGIHTRAFRGAVKPVQKAVSRFHEAMYKKYNDYQIIGMSPVQLADSTCMYVTFQVGTMRVDDMEIPRGVVEHTI